MFQPDSAQLVVSLVLIVMAAAVLLLFWRHEGLAWLALGVLAVFGLSAVLSYVEADRHWDTLTSTIEGQRFESVLVNYPHDEVEFAKTKSIITAFDEHASEVGSIKTRKNAPGGCEIVVTIGGCPLRTVSELQWALTDVYGCEATVIGVFGSSGSTPAPPPV